MRNRVQVAAVSAAMAMMLLGAAPAGARDLSQAGLSRADVVAWLQSRGYQARIVHDDVAGADYVASADSGVNYGIYFYNCNAQEVCTAIQYAVSWSGTGTTAERLNEWNRDFRYVRAYLDRYNNVFGEYDLDVAPGGTWEALNQSLDRWNYAMAEFKRFLNQ